jgi:hypothetical protein
MRPAFRSLLVAVIGVTCVAPAAGAQPVTSPSRCEVTFARAPDDVRAVIETWVRAESRCSTTLEVRVVPTEGGLYLMARDGQGRVRERVVPDAQSAGVLVASWVADDAPAPSGTPPGGPVGPGAPVDAPSASVELAPPQRERGPELTAPGATPAIVLQTAPAPRVRTRWLSLGGMTQVGGSGGGGVRGELDLASRGRWSVGATVSASETDLVLAGFSGAGFVHTRDLQAVATLARTSSWDHWQLRLAVGAGLVRTAADGFVDGQSIAATGVFPTAELSALATRKLGTTWGVAAGPILTVYSQVFGLHQDQLSMQRQQRDPELMACFALRRRL